MRYDDFKAVLSSMKPAKVSNPMSFHRLQKKSAKLLIIIFIHPFFPLILKDFRFTSVSDIKRKGGFRESGDCKSCYVCVYYLWDSGDRVEQAPELSVFPPHLPRKVPAGQLEGSCTKLQAVK